MKKPKPPAFLLSGSPRYVNTKYGEEVAVTSFLGMERLERGDMAKFRGVDGCEHWFFVDDITTVRMTHDWH